MAKDTARRNDSSPATVGGATRAALNVEPSAPAKAPAAEAPPAGGAEKEARPTAATAAIGLMLVAGGVDLGLGVYWALWGGNALGGLFFLFVGIAYLYGGRGLYAGESWGWGAGIMAGAFAILFGVPLLPFGAIPSVLAVVVIVPLVLVREYYGMVRYRPKEEERQKEERHAERTRNPEGLHCPHCGSTRLWIAADGSAYCDNCKTGTIALRPTA